MKDEETSSQIAVEVAGLSFEGELFTDGDVFVVHLPRLDVSSCGSTAEGALRNIREALVAFLQYAKNMGVLEDILQEAEYEINAEQLVLPIAEFVDQESNHFIYRMPGVNRPFVLPIFRPLPRFIVGKILDAANVPRERYEELMEQMMEANS